MITMKQEEKLNDPPATTTTSVSPFKSDSTQTESVVPELSDVVVKVPFQSPAGGIKPKQSDQPSESDSFSLPPKVELSPNLLHPQYDQIKLQQATRLLFLEQKQKCIASRNARILAAKEKWAPTLQQVIKAKDDECRQINADFRNQMEFLMKMEAEFGRASAANRISGNQFDLSNRQLPLNQAQSQNASKSDVQNSNSMKGTLGRLCMQDVLPKLKEDKMDEDHKENEIEPKNINDLLEMTMSEEIMIDEEDESMESVPSVGSSPEFIETEPCKIVGVKEYLRKLDLDSLEKVTRGSKWKSSGYKCPLDECNAVISRQYDMRRHIRLSHNGDAQQKPFCCPESGCNQRFSLRQHIKEHVDSVHRGLKPFKCPVCKRPFARKRDINKHCRRRHKQYYQSKMK